MSLTLNRFRNWPTVVLCPSNFDDARGTRVVFYSLMKQRIITCSQFTCNQKWNQSNALWTLTTTIVIGEPKLHWVITEHITTRSSVLIHNITTKSLFQGKEAGRRRGRRVTLRRLHNRQRRGIGHPNPDFQPIMNFHHKKFERVRKYMWSYKKNCQTLAFGITCTSPYYLFLSGFFTINRTVTGRVKSHANGTWTKCHSTDHVNSVNTPPELKVFCRHGACSVRNDRVQV